jgi:GNAT superfamily N-acetyltransferase
LRVPRFAETEGHAFDCYAAPMAGSYRLRRGTPDDSRAAFEVFLAAVGDLTRRQGVPWEPDPEELWDELTPMLDFLAHHAAEWWVAEADDDGAVIGHARSAERGGMFELTELFVHPDRQSKGLGADLMAHAFPNGRGDVRVIIATTDVRAQARYYAAGTAARFPIVALEGEPHPVAPDPAVEIVRIGPGDDLGPLVEIERAVIEFDRGDEFRWLLGQREGYLYRRDGRPIGFSFVSKGGSGPIAALEPSDMVPILGHVETRLAELEVKQLSLEIPMINEVAMRHLIARGMRMDTFITLFMSSRPFGRFDRFIGFSPPYFL